MVKQGKLLELRCQVAAEPSQARLLQAAIASLMSQIVVVPDMVESIMFKGPPSELQTLELSCNPSIIACRRMCEYCCCCNAFEQIGSG